MCVGSDRSPYFARIEVMWKRRKSSLSSLPWEVLHECTQRSDLKVPEKQYGGEHSHHNAASFPSITQFAQLPSLQQLQPEISVGVLQGPLAAGTQYIPFPCERRLCFTLPRDLSQPCCIFSLHISMDGREIFTHSFTHIFKSKVVLRMDGMNTLDPAHNNTGALQEQHNSYSCFFPLSVICLIYV